MSETSNKTTNGRDGSGRFTAGNQGGPGNPFARQAAAFRKAIQSAVTAEDMADLARVVRAKAQGGDLAAIRLLWSYGAGRPGPGPDPDTLDAHELAVRRQNTATPEDMKALFEAVPASLLCAIAQVVTPVMHAHLEKQFADGVRRQGEIEAEGRKTVPDAPGPYPGWKADWAPEWLKSGRMPEGMEELFYSCPAWAPDFFGTDKAPHAFGTMLQKLRKNLLADLDSERRWLSETDGKRNHRHGLADAAGGLGREALQGEPSLTGTPKVPPRPPRPAVEADRVGAIGASEGSPASPSRSNGQIVPVDDHHR